LLEEKGTYLLFLSLQKEINIQVGSLGSISFEKGNFIYIGSALGPGGLKKRVSRHLKQEKKIFWHIDYLLNNDFVDIKVYGAIYSNKKIECDIVHLIKELFNEDLLSIKNFGSSDCNCVSHLLFFKIHSIKELVSQLKDGIGKKQLDIVYL